ncbi:hypothetical protein [Streptomyces inhibens]|uniref:hypothetical protein n=1 Tax=Streptomyces inhibens TaxID=2293571 RepID=UPI001EE6E668|nr:hypothetical protein [Streptomyces inhibens]UKY53721.1 hypothetical protein KI385_36250 [Streptomyces inhibens]
MTSSKKITPGPADDWEAQGIESEAGGLHAGGRSAGGLGHQIQDVVEAGADEGVPLTVPAERRAVRWDKT